jgi:hypothetical protein
MTDDQPTCGKGLAANAVLPQKLSALLSAQANLLENHVRSLDPNEFAGRAEREAYERLGVDQRALASNLTALATAMQSYRDLPIAKHDMSQLTDSASRGVLVAFVDAERGLVEYLQKQIQDFESMLRTIPG